MKSLELRRAIAFVVLMYAGACAFDGLSVRGDSIQDKPTRAHFMFFDGWYPLIDSANGRVLFYRADESTTGAGYEVDSMVTADSSWAMTFPARGDSWNAWHYDDHGSRQVIYARTFFGSDSFLPDSAIDRATLFMGHVIPPRAYQDGSIEPRHIDRDSSFTITLGGSSDVALAALPTALLDEADFDALFDQHFVDSLNSGWHVANLDSLYTDSAVVALWCSLKVAAVDSFDADSAVIRAALVESLAVTGNVELHSSAVTGAGLDVTSGAVDIDTSPSAGHATLIEEEDALQVRYSTTFSEDAAKGLILADDGVDTDLIKDSNTPSEDDFATFTTTKRIEWKTHAEASIAKVVGSGYADMPNNTVDTLMIYASGALTSDDCLCSFSGRPRWMTGLELYVAALGCSVSVADSVKVWRAPSGTRNFTQGDLTFFWMILRNP
jgi:hypothetical protein